MSTKEPSVNRCPLTWEQWERNRLNHVESLADLVRAKTDVVAVAKRYFMSVLNLILLPSVGLIILIALLGLVTFGTCMYVFSIGRVKLLRPLQRLLSDHMAT